MTTVWCFDSIIMEVLERLVEEVSVVEMIYGMDFESDNSTVTTQMTIVNLDVYKQLNEAIRDGSTIADVPCLLEKSITLEFITKYYIAGKVACATIHVTLPSGYPETAAAIVSIVNFDKFNRNQRDLFAKELNNHSSSMIGSESLMELIHFWQDRGEDMLSSLENRDREEEGDEPEAGSSSSIDESSEFKRVWIWVHHITNKDRRRNIVQEANDRNLHGYLKHGYPGIVLIEGSKVSCDDYVKWIKGNKSRENGFGRNWSHHVKGEIDIDKCVFSNQFNDIGEDLSVLSEICRDLALEDEFRKFVMKH